MDSLFVSFPIFTSFTIYCNFHYLHHRHLWDINNDPDTKRYALIRLDKPQSSMKIFIMKHIIKPLTLTHVPKYIYGTIKVNIFSKEEPWSERIAKVLFWVLIITISVTFNFWQELILFWFVPLLTTFKQQVLRLFTLLQKKSKNPTVMRKRQFLIYWVIV